MMRRREWLLLLAVLLTSLSLCRSAEAFGGRKRNLAYSYSGAGGHWVPVAPTGYTYAPTFSSYGSRPVNGGYAGGGSPGSGYGGGYYGLQGYNNNALGPGMPGSSGIRLVWGNRR
jgi:hypothetical protein